MNAAVIDTTIFAELQEAAGAEFVAELVGTFLEEAPGMLAELRSARAAGGSRSTPACASHNVRGIGVRGSGTSTSRPSARSLGSSG